MSDELELVRFETVDGWVTLGMGLGVISLQPQYVDGFLAKSKDHLFFPYYFVILKDANGKIHTDDHNNTLLNCYLAEDIRMPL